MHVDGPTRVGVRLSVIIPTLGNHELLGRVLDGYERQTASRESFELIDVVDPADPDPTGAGRAIADRPYPVRWFVGERHGASASRNAGAALARGALIAFTDNDTIPVANLVREHLEWHERHPQDEVAVLGHVRWDSRRHATPFMRWLDAGIQFDYPSIDGVDAGWGRFYTANVSLKRRFFNRVGGFDEERLPYLYEDLDWGYRASRHGLSLLYNRDAIADHVRPGLTLRAWEEKARRLAVAERRFVEIHPELEPWFYNLFEPASHHPPGRGRAVWLARWVPRWVPWLGPLVWQRADLHFRQTLASPFMAAWKEAADGS